MARKETTLDTRTSREHVPLRLKIYRLMRKVLIGFILASVVNFLFSFFFYTPKMYSIARENEELMFKYGLMREKINTAARKLDEIKHRDNNVYRSLFAADTLDIPQVYWQYPDQKYAEMAGDLYGDLMVGTWRELDALSRAVYLQSRSLDELQLLSFDKERMALAIPAIWPIDKRYLKGSIGLFGGRNHPTLGRFQMHTGIDLGANKGTPVYATGNGIVLLDPNKGTGYGLQVLIDHGFGYKTRYAHLSSVHVIPGQVVQRGEMIGEVGSTGRSTGPHLHYEVIYMNNHVDPINYFRRDMDQDEFEKIIRNASITTYERND